MFVHVRILWWLNERWLVFLLRWNIFNQRYGLFDRYLSLKHVAFCRWFLLDLKYWVFRVRVLQEESLVFERDRTFPYFVLLKSCFLIVVLVVFEGITNFVLLVLVESIKVLFLDFIKHFIHLVSSSNWRLKLLKLLVGATYFIWVKRYRPT